MKNNRVLATMIWLSLMTATVTMFVNCSPNSAATSNPAPAPNPTPTPTPNNPQACSTAELNQLDADLSAALATAVTDVDFSLQLESEDGRRFNFDRGTSTMNSSYKSASTSKWVSATVILSYMESTANLMSSKPLTLSAKPQDFIEAANWTIPTTDTLYNLNLRQLLSFTSGLEQDPPCINTTMPAGDMAACVKNIGLENIGTGVVPGTRFFYSSNHLQVAGLMAMRARDIAKGFAVGTSTWQDIFTEFKTRTSLFANSDFDIPSLINPRLAGGMHWTGNDYFAFVKATYFKQILSASIMPGQSATYYNQQFSDQISTAAIISSPAKAGIGEDWHYGFGLWAECHATTYSCGASIESFSSPGAYGAYPFMNRSQKFYGILSREGALGTFRSGYDLYASVSAYILKWAAKDCN